MCSERDIVLHTVNESHLAGAVFSITHHLPLSDPYLINRFLVSIMSDNQDSQSHPCNSGISTVAHTCFFSAERFTPSERQRLDVARDKVGTALTQVNRLDLNDDIGWKWALEDVGRKNDTKSIMASIKSRLGRECNGTKVSQNKVVSYLIGH
jgi:hypothetical protein